MNRADLIAGAAFTVAGLLILFVVIPLAVPGHDEGDYGLRAQDFPFVTAGLMTLLSGLLVGIRLTVATPGAPTAPEQGGAPLSWRNGRFLMLVSILFVVTFLLLDTIGIAAGGPLIIATFMLVLGERRPVPIVLMSVGVPLLIWLFFWKLLRFPLP